MHKYIEEIKKALPKDYSAKGDFVVFVDECHRTQSGKLHVAMKTIIPNGIFIGFTGTPLLKKDKKTSLETFGGYIHTYKFDEAVRDGVVLDLGLEIGRDLQNQEVDHIGVMLDLASIESHHNGVADFRQVEIYRLAVTFDNLIHENSPFFPIIITIYAAVDSNGHSYIVLLVV